MAPVLYTENSTLYIVRAVLDPDDSGDIVYNMEARSKRKCPDLSIHPSTGVVTVSKGKFRAGLFVFLLFSV